jgi:anti-sigma B factor antagonist
VIHALFYPHMLLDIQESKIGDITVLRLSGKLALGRESQRIETMVEDFARQGQTKVILDMIAVSYIDSAGIGLLAMTAGKLKESGGKLVVVSAPDGRTTQLLKLTQMNSIVPMCSTMDEAESAFAG